MELSNWINPEILENKEILKKKFSKSQFFRHISIDNFLIKKKAEILFENLKSLDYYKEENDLYCFFRTVDFKTLDNNIIKEFRSFLLSLKFIEFIEYITNSKINKKIIDLHSLKLVDTNYLLCHDDQVLGRQLAFIFNLSKNFEIKDEGQLELFETDKNGKVLPKVFKKIQPKFNQFNMFKVSSNSYHQIGEVTSNKKRISIGGWFHE